MSNNSAETIMKTMDFRWEKRLRPLTLGSDQFDAVLQQRVIILNDPSDENGRQRSEWRDIPFVWQHQDLFSVPIQPTQEAKSQAPATEPKLYHIWSNKKQLWWGKNGGNHFVGRREFAAKYTLQEAIDICKSGGVSYVNHPANINPAIVPTSVMFPAVPTSVMLPADEEE